MVFVKYDVPLPNYNGRYNLSKEELIELLEYVYNRGFEHARDIYDPSRQGTLTWASSDNNKKLKEVYINE